MPEQGDNPLLATDYVTWGILQANPVRVNLELFIVMPSNGVPSYCRHPDLRRSVFNVDISACV